MLRKIKKSLIVFIEIVAISFGIAVSFAVWKFYSGPISIQKAIPYIAEALNVEQMDVKIDIEQAYLEYDSLDKPLNVRLVGIDIFDNNSVQIVRVPEIIIDFSFEAILKGELFPKNVIIPMASLRLHLTDDGRLLGNIQNDTFNNSDFDIGKIIKGFLSSNHNPYFEGIAIEKAEFQLKYQDTFYEFPEFNMNINQGNRAYSINIDAMAMIGVQAVNFKFDAVYDRHIKTCEAMLELSPFNPNMFQDSIKYPFLDIVNMSIGGKFFAFLKLDKFEKIDDLSFVDKASFELFGYNGVIRLPFLDENEIYPLNTLSVKGDFEKGLKSLNIPKIKITADDGVATGNITIKGLDEFILNQSVAQLRIEIDAGVPSLANENLKKYWPQSIGPDVREWLHQNITGGLYNNSQFKMIFIGNEKEEIVSELIDGTLDVENATVDYIEGMPKAVGVGGHAHVTLDRVDVVVKKGGMDGLKMTSGTLAFTNIRDPQEFADIKLEIEGDLQKALEVVDSKPFEYMKELNLLPKNVNGQMVTSLKLFFPLDVDLSVDKVKADVNAKIMNTDINNAFGDVDIKNAEFSLVLNNEKLVLSGIGDISNLASNIIFTKYFNKENNSVYELTTIINSSLIGEHYPKYEFLNNFIKGEIPIHAAIRLDKYQKGEMEINFDIVNAVLDLGGIGWYKDSAKPGIINLRIPVNKTEKYITVNITDKKENNINGLVDFNENGEVSRIAFYEIKGTMTDASMIIDLIDDKIQGKVSGKNLDMKGFLKSLTSGNKTKLLSSGIKKSDMYFGYSDINFNVELDALSFGRRARYKNVVGSVLLSKTLPDRIKIETLVGKDNNKAEFSLLEDGDINQFLLISDDAGDNLRALGIMGNIRGGELKIDGVINKNGEISGKIEVEDFYFLKAPTLVQLLSLASFTGIVDSLEGNGVKMDEFIIPYKFKNGKVSLTDAHTSGSGFGLTAWGEVDFVKDEIDIKGSIVPAYTLNSILSKIPLLGELFSSEKGSGLLNFSYGITGLIDAPVITVNPLAVLTPGAVKGILDAGADAIEDVPVDRIND